MSRRACNDLLQTVWALSWCVAIGVSIEVTLLVLLGLMMMCRWWVLRLSIARNSTLHGSQLAMMLDESSSIALLLYYWIN